MKFICLATAWLGSACGTFHVAQHDTARVARAQGIGLGMKHLGRYGKTIRHTNAITYDIRGTTATVRSHDETTRHASTLVSETSVWRLGKRVSAIHAQVFAERQRLEATMAQLDDPHTLLHRNADFQQLSLDFKQKLGYRMDDGSLQLAVDFTRVDDEAAQSILQQLQEIEIMLSTPLRGVEKVLAKQ